MGKLATIPGANLVPKINAAHRAFCGNAMKAMEDAAECGRLLLEAKELVPHGEWVTWLEANTEVGERQSQKYMRLARNWDELAGKSELNNSFLGGIDGALKLLTPPKPKAKPDDEERDRKACIALYQKVCEAESELAKAAGKTPKPKKPIEYSAPVAEPITDPSKGTPGKVWITSPCGTPLWETQFNTVEEAGAALEKSRKMDKPRRAYLRAVEKYVDDLDEEAKSIIEELREIASERASTLPQDGRSEGAMDDPTPARGRAA